jgi:pimeloyl-ACP methyl ester carboxylesterase
MFVNVGGRRQWVEVSGSGLPAIVLESGCGGSSSDWTAIQATLSRYTTVIAYDRAGSGRSEASGNDRRASTMAVELRELLDVLEIERPIMLVGLSLGGLIVREYERLHREDVCALLLLEPAHEDLQQMMPPDYWAQEERELQTAAAMSRHTRPGFAAELNALSETTREMRSVRDHSLGDLPLTVVTARKKWSDVAPPIDRAAVDAAWVSLHQRTAALSSEGQRIEALRSGHNVHLDSPELVVDQALALLERAGKRVPEPVDFTSARRPV